MSRSILLLACISLACAIAQTRDASDCDRLKALGLPNTTITAAEFVPGGPFVIPGATPNNQKPTYAASRCRVTAVMKPSSDSEIEIEVWMPSSDWNGKFLGVGNGGWSGAISYGGLLSGLREGYATASTDTGHKGGRGSFALGHPEKLIDFGHRAVHEMTVKGKAIVAAYYGSGPKRSYWNGCSSGGKQGLKEAQMYPADYDGIIAGAPANYWTHLSSSLMHFGVTNLKDPSATIPRNKYPLLNNAVLAACDTLDGVKDGILTDPRRCRFNPSVLACRGSESADCLTPPQIETAKAIYGPVNDPRTGKKIFPGLARGSELAWAPAIGGPEPFGITYDHFKYVVHEDPNWDWRNFDLARDTAAADEKDKHIGATNPDLKTFRARGGKLILWHGWIDQLIAPENSIDYYTRVLEVMGPKQDDWMRLFMAPGILHCSGGPGPDQFNGIAALERWVEQGIAPAQITAYHVTDNRVDMSRPLCPYPQVAEYKGSGSTNDAANFTCKQPRPDSR
jgi:feruloyl esterase